MIVAGVSIWLPTLGQLVLLNRRLAAQIEPGPKAYDVRALAHDRAADPDGRKASISLLAYTDVLVLQQFPAARRGRGLLRRRQDAARWSLSSITRYRRRPRTASAPITSPATAPGCRPSSRSRSSWTFWPSLAATALLLAFGRPIAEPVRRRSSPTAITLMFILAVGLLARAAIGPIERLLNMLGEQRVSRWSMPAPSRSISRLCFVLIPLLRPGRRRDRDRERR